MTKPSKQHHKDVFKKHEIVTEEMMHSLLDDTANHIEDDKTVTKFEPRTVNGLATTGFSFNTRRHRIGRKYYYRFSVESNVDNIPPSWAKLTPSAYSDTVKIADVDDLPEIARLAHSSEMAVQAYHQYVNDSGAEGSYVMTKMYPILGAFRIEPHGVYFDYQVTPEGSSTPWSDATKVPSLSQIGFGKYTATSTPLVGRVIGQTDRSIYHEEDER